MQLHPDDKNWGREKELLEKTCFIGVKSSKKKELKKFKNDIAINDIILIRRCSMPIAMVEVIGEIEDSLNIKFVHDDLIDDDYNRLDWFRYRRKIKILAFADEDTDGKYYSFLSSTDFLAKAFKGKIYKYIESWHKKISPSFFKSQVGLKIRKIYIQKFQIFEEFNFNTTHNNEALSLLVIAGINGSGKTTLLEYIKNFAGHICDKDNDKSFIEFEMYDDKSKHTSKQILNYANSQDTYLVGGNTIRQESLIKNYFENNVIYFSSDTVIDNIKYSIPKYLENLVWKNDVKASEAKQSIRTYINDLFRNIGISIEFDDIDEKELFFRNSKGDKFHIDKISTGEKTLMSKVLYLYLEEIKDKVILIDEPELSLHPAWQNKVLKLYENFALNNNCQIIIATHSPHIIGGAKPEYIRVLRRNRDGNIEALDGYQQSYGLEFDKVLLEIMDMNETRTPDVEKELVYIKEQIYSNNFLDNKEFADRWGELEKNLGKDDLDLKLLRLEMNMREKRNAPNNQK